MEQSLNNVYPLFGHHDKDEEPYSHKPLIILQHI